MLTAIQLYDQAFFEADEVDNEGPDRVLPTELHIGKLAIAQ